MRELKFFVCEVCNTAYQEREHAKRCEKRGIEGKRVEVGKEYKLNVPALTRPNAFLRQRPITVTMRVKVVKLEGPLSHDSHHTSDWQIRLNNEPEFCHHFEPHLDGQHVYYVKYKVLAVSDREAVIDGTLLGAWMSGGCSQRNFWKYVDRDSLK